MHCSCCARRGISTGAVSAANEVAVARASMQVRPASSRDAHVIKSPTQTVPDAWGETGATLLPMSPGEKRVFLMSFTGQKLPRVVRCYAHLEIWSWQRSGLLCGAPHPGELHVIGRLYCVRSSKFSSQAKPLGHDGRVGHTCLYKQQPLCSDRWGAGLDGRGDRGSARR